MAKEKRINCGFWAAESDKKVWDDYLEKHPGLVWSEWVREVLHRACGRRDLSKASRLAEAARPKRGPKKVKPVLASSKYIDIPPIENETERE